jgi:hypothetical protein
MSDPNSRKQKYVYQIAIKETRMCVRLAGKLRPEIATSHLGTGVKRSKLSKRPLFDLVPRFVEVSVEIGPRYPRSVGPEAPRRRNAKSFGPHEDLHPDHSVTSPHRHTHSV